MKHKCERCHRDITNCGFIVGGAVICCDCIEEALNIKDKES